MAEILSYAVLADQLGLEVFAVGEHHSAEFFTSSPPVVLAAVAARTTGIRLTSATTLLGVADPVRVYEGFASLDVISRGRAEITVGRSAFTRERAAGRTTPPAQSVGAAAAGDVTGWLALRRSFLSSPRQNTRLQSASPRPLQTAAVSRPPVTP
jgi:alkanesulfonate monooxygenase SsuD/methylene tetrahydromethanopterin reductase-like flavin-dependent oxidoreductase (luciferase family)